MRYIFAGLGLLVIIGLLVSAILAGPRAPTGLEYAQADYAMAQLAKREQVNEALLPLDLLLGAFWRLVPVFAVVGAGTLVWRLSFDQVQRRRAERWPDERGLLPVNQPLLDVISPAALAAYHGARLEDARRPMVPTVPHHLVIHNPPAPPVPPAPPTPPAPSGPPAPPAPPSFAQLLEDGRVGKGNPLLLGFERLTGKPVEGSWLDLYSCAVGGLSGSGKSTTAAFLAAQATLHGARIVLLDPHAQKQDSLTKKLAPLARRYVCAAAETPTAMVASVRLVQAELERRKAGGRGEPWLFLADEFTMLQRGALAEPLGQLVEALGQEGRGMGLYAMVCGQIWTAARTGGTELRDSLASAYVHRLRPSQARYLTGLTSAELPDDLLSLPPGTCYLLSTAGELRAIQIPSVGADDLSAVALMAAEGAEGKLPIGFRPAATGRSAEAPLEAYASAHPDAANVPAEDAEILEALKGGKSPSEVAAGLAGSNSGRRYQEASRRVADVIRRALQHA